MRKTVLIFGGTGGIGQAIYLRFKEKGYGVYATSHSKQSPDFFKCDIKKINDVKRVISRTLEKAGQIDIVINCVSPPLKLKTISQLTNEDFRQDINTILLGGINIGKAASAVMKPRRSGVIVNLLSATVLGKVSSRMSSYISAKYGLLGFTKCLALELSAFDIFVYGISPSFVQTDLINPFPKKLIELEKNLRVSKELIQTKEVADLVLEIVQNPQKYQSGENIELA